MSDKHETEAPMPLELAENLGSIEKYDDPTVFNDGIRQGGSGSTDESKEERRGFSYSPRFEVELEITAAKVEEKRIRDKYMRKHAELIPLIELLYNEILRIKPDDPVKFAAGVFFGQDNRRTLVELKQKAVEVARSRDDW